MASRGDERQKQGISDAAKTSSPVRNKLLQKGYRFNFFQAVHLLEKLNHSSSQTDQIQSLSQESIRFQPSTKLSFPPTDIRDIKRLNRNGTDIILVILTFMGLYGVDSPLPPYFSEIISALSDEEDAEELDPGEYDSEEGAKSLRHLLDIFNHRTYSFYYQSWKKYRYYLQYISEATDRFSQYMLSLMGLGSPALQEAIGVKLPRVIAHAGVLGQQTRCADGLSCLLSGYFSNIAVRVIQFMPRWVVIPEQYRARLLTKRKGGRTQLRLGENLTIGERVRDLCGRFRVALGPLNLTQFRGFLPGKFNVAHLELCRLIRFYAPDLLTYEIELLLRKEEVPPLRLLKKDERLSEVGYLLSVQLGWTSWLGKPQEDIVSIVFSIDRDWLMGQ